MGVKKGTYPGATWATNNNGSGQMQGYEWYGLGTTYSPHVDTNYIGYSKGALRRSYTGGYWNSEFKDYFGSRSIECNTSGSTILSNVTTRGCNERNHCTILGRNLLVILQIVL